MGSTQVASSFALLCSLGFLFSSLGQQSEIRDFPLECHVMILQVMPRRAEDMLRASNMQTTFSTMWGIPSPLQTLERQGWNVHYSTIRSWRRADQCSSSRLHSGLSHLCVSDEEKKTTLQVLASAAHILKNTTLQIPNVSQFSDYCMSGENSHLSPARTLKPIPFLLQHYVGNHWRSWIIEE